MDDYLPIVVMFVLAVGFVVLSLVTTKMVASSRPTDAKLAPYECGIVPSREPARRFPVRFYLVAMIFIIFDIEIIFLFPWATVFRELGGYGLGVMMLFIVPFFLSFAWEISQGGLDWGPRKRMRRLDPAAALGRAPGPGVRRVTSPGLVAGSERRPVTAPAPEEVHA
ncbi:MAG TPA: NADH-quinone oxidoreductase subunit A [Acidimicrobiales bacterium]|nr:NADH-quinone oxidoreductase subunit A [Acidimicrobiales bacterium]